MGRIGRRLFLLVGLGLLPAACHQNGTVFAVDTTDDTVDANPGDGICADANGDCSLRAAVMEANALPGVEEIRLVEGETYLLDHWFLDVDDDEGEIGDLDITAGVVLTGKGTVERTSASPAFDVHTDELVEFAGLRFVGNGIRAQPESRVLIDRVDAFAIRNGRWLEIDDAWVSVTRTTIVDWDGFDALAIDFDGGTLFVDALTTSLEGPITSLGFPGIALRVGDGNATVGSSTLVGGRLINDAGGGTLTVRNSIIDEDCEGEITSGGGNVGFSASGCSLTDPADRIEARSWPFDVEIADNGGDVRTYALDSSHPAVDQASTSGCSLTGTDARGVDRPIGPACDAGAYELDVGIDCGAPGPGADLRNCDFEGADLVGIDLTGADLTGANLTGADLTGATLVGADLRGAYLDEAVFDGANLTDADLTESDGGFYAAGADLTRALLDGAAARTLDGANLTDVFGGHFGTWYPSGSMVGAHIEGADFSDGYFWGVTSGGITGSATFRPGVGVVNSYLFDRFVDVPGLDFSGADFSAVGLWNVDATGTDFSNAVLTLSVSESDFIGASLDGADLSTTYGWFVDFDSSSLVGVDAREADLYSSGWDDAVVIGTDFTDANLWNASFRDAVVLWNTFDNTTCPTGVNSDANGGTCDGEWGTGEPISGAAAMQALSGLGLEGLSAADFAPAE